MNFGGEYSADGLQFDQAAKPPIRHPRMARCPCPSRARGGVAAEDAHCSERLTGSRRVRRPQPGNAGVEGRASDRPTDWRTPPWHHPQRTPGRKPGSGALIESTIGLRIVNLAKHQVPRALSKPSTKFPEHYPSRVPNSQSISRAKQRAPVAKNRQFYPAVVTIDDSSQHHDQNARLFALSGSPCANNRQKRPFPTSETAKNRLF